MASTNRGFSAILDDIVSRRLLDVGSDDSAAASAEGAAPSIPFDYLAVADELHSGRIRIAADAAAMRYGDAVDLSEYEQSMLDRIFVDESADAEPAIELPSLPEATDPETIATELALDRAGVGELAGIRRRFAFANHPDRLPQHLRQRAMVRMQIANMLIDAAARRLNGRS